MKIKPSGYKTAAESVQSGYLQKRMREYARRVAEQQKSEQQADQEAQAKVRPIKKAKAK